jgi:hypothetical protein
VDPESGAEKPSTSSQGWHVKGTPLAPTESSIKTEKMRTKVDQQKFHKRTGAESTQMVAFEARAINQKLTELSKIASALQSIDSQVQENNRLTTELLLIKKEELKIARDSLKLRKEKLEAMKNKTEPPPYYSTSNYSYNRFNNNRRGPPRGDGGSSTSLAESRPNIFHRLSDM